MDAVAARAATYQRHAPEQDLLYQVLSQHLETFLKECRTEAHDGAPRLARVFSLDVTVCPCGGGPMRMIAALTHPDSIRTYLTGVGLPADPPVISPARPPPQQELEFAA